MKERYQLIGEIRYAIRLTQRTARLYRRVQTAGIFLSILGGSATMVSLADGMPNWVASSGGIILAIAGAMLIAVRPADKAAQNESDVKRYQSLSARAVNMNDAELEQAIEDAHNGDAPEIESLRDVAYNDIALEFNRPDVLVPLSPVQKILRTLA
ncbi:hypothetical protein C8R34_11146 [Nitrosomonas sp. Nm84]|uniref:hypothetical protein n=1 Tax=Nitrosomonas sp. Nm84 TaxID=200124 RepID=UPI000D772AA0|nr:hypothetical protein [Nitrosomonas sp. Nm84]PXW87263.1 hypothetical protein C8R34_11146 [Nitrosomonas sp. Nm84]